MLGERGPQRGLFAADNLYADFVGSDSFYGFLASHRDDLFRDEDFAELYCPESLAPKRDRILMSRRFLGQPFWGSTHTTATPRPA